MDSYADRVSDLSNKNYEAESDPIPARVRSERRGDGRTGHRASAGYSRPLQKKRNSTEGLNWRTFSARATRGSDELNEKPLKRTMGGRFKVFGDVTTHRGIFQRGH